MVRIPAVVPALPRERTLERHLPPTAAFGWLRAGANDLRVRPALSLAYGLLVFLVSVVVVLGLFVLRWDYILFPALAGFMVVGPIFAIGLYEKSRRIAAGEPVTPRQMIFVRPESGGQILFVGVLLCGLMLLWMRSAVIIYALFFGVRPFPGFDRIVGTLFVTPIGWWILIVGSLVGGVFAAFSFAISVFAIPMQLEERVDALTAMGLSMALVWNNLGVMLTWALLVLVLTLAGLATGLVGLIVVFPLLGHGTWHAYRAMRPPTGE